jgi:hypothetical protein
MENIGQKVLPEFDREEDEDAYFLTYGWTDFSGNFLELSFPLAKDLIKEAEKEFGYFPEDLKKHMDDHMERSQERMIEELRKFVEHLIQKSKFPEYILIENVTAKSFDLKLSVPSSLHNKVKREYDKIKTKLAKEQKRYSEQAEKEREAERERFFESRGIRVFDDKLGVNHSICVMRNKQRIRPIFEIMQKNSPIILSTNFWACFWDLSKMSGIIFLLFERGGRQSFPFGFLRGSWQTILVTAIRKE